MKMVVKNLQQLAEKKDGSYKYIQIISGQGEI
jgi:hypothetical protein